MADVAITPDKPGSGGASATATSMSASNNYIVRNNGRVLLHFIKSGAGEATITIVTPATNDGLAVAERTIAVAASTGDVVAGPFPPGTYNDISGDMDVSTDEGTGLTMYAVEL